MSKLIDKLVALSSEESIDGPYADDYVDQEKFAKLIIKELSDMLELSGHHYAWVTIKFKERLGIE
jgi:hypothetical protein